MSKAAKSKKEEEEEVESEEEEVEEEEEEEEEVEEDTSLANSDVVTKYQEAAKIANNVLKELIATVSHFLLFEVSSYYHYYYSI